MKKKIVSVVLVVSFVFASVFASNAATQSSAIYQSTSTTKSAQPSSISLRDITRILTVIRPSMKQAATEGKLHHDDGTKVEVPHQTHIDKDQATIVNAKQLGNLEWIVRFKFGEGDAEGRGAVYEDYRITTLGYYADNTNPADPKYYMVYPDGSKELVTSFDRTLVKYGKDLGPNTKGSAYYFGLFDDLGNHDICGFGVATRLKRWPEWNDLSYSYQSETIEFPENSGKYWVRGEFIGCADSNKFVRGFYDQPSSTNYLAEHGLVLNAAGTSYVSRTTVG